MHIELNPVRIYKKYRRRFHQAHLRRLVNGYDINGYRRIYHFHSRKTAGTSVAKMFLSLNGNDGGHRFDELALQADRPLLSDGLIFVGWDKRLIELGEYYFAFSHLTYDDLQLPPNTFRFTSLRDPSDRVLSHYRMLLDFSKQSDPHSSFAEERHWLGNSFSDFLDRIPREHLQNQLYMFSKQFEVDEAIERVARLEHVILFDDLNNGLRSLSRKTGIQLAVRHDRRGVSEFEVGESDRARLKELLVEEYEFYTAVQDKCDCNHQVPSHHEVKTE